jgi:UDP-N-acetylmuramoyl-tripeptide--D-alanyl-D-alanine ligase
MKLRVQDFHELSYPEFHECDRLLRQSPHRVVTDSRVIKKGDVFIAFRGERVDAHEHVGEAFAAGAMFCVVEHRWWKLNRERMTGRPLIIVPDTIRAYGEIAKLHRRGFNVPLVGITGSNGKTATKEMAAAVLRTRFHILQNEGNLNNHIGVPATLLQLNDTHELVVTEMGTNQPGDIALLCDIAAPTHGVITNIGRAHLEKLGSRRGVAVEKTVLFTSLPESGIAVYNSDEPLLRPMLPANGQCISFGVSRKADVRVVNIRLDARGGAIAKIHAPRFAASRIEVHLRFAGRHAALNAAAALAVGYAFDCDTDAMVTALESLAPVDGRVHIVNAGGVLVIDDTYNANPDSMYAALTLLRDVECSGRRCAVLSDMLELGPASREEHELIGASVEDMGVHYLFTCGDGVKAVHRSARRRKRETGSKELNVKYVAAREALVDEVEAVLRPGDVVLIKGSRGMKMNLVADELIQRLNSREAAQ